MPLYVLLLLFYFYFYLLSVVLLSVHVIILDRSLVARISCSLRKSFDALTLNYGKLANLRAAQQTELNLELELELK